MTKKIKTKILKVSPFRETLDVNILEKIKKLERIDFIKVWFDFAGEHIKPDELIIKQLIAIYK